MKSASVDSGLFRAALRNSFDLMCLLEEDGVCIEVSPAVMQVLGYAPESWIGAKFVDYIHPEDTAAFETALAVGAEDQLPSCRLRTKNGRWLTFEFQCSRVPAEDGRNCFLIVCRQAAAPEPCHELEVEFQRLRDILANLPCAVWESHTDLDTMESKVVYINEYAARLFGHDPERWLSEPELAMETIHPDDREALYGLGAEIATTGEPGSMEYRAIAANGRVFWAQCHMTAVRDAGGKIIGLRGVTLDISDRIQAQEGQRRLASLLDVASIFVGWSDASGRVQYVNPAGRRMVGLSEDEDVTHLTIAAFAPDWAVDMLFSQALPRAAKTGSWSGESALLHVDGHEIPVAQVVTFHRDAHGGEEFFSTIAHDITLRKEAEETLKRAKDGLEQRVRDRTEALANSNRALQDQITERQIALRALQEAVAAHEHARTEADQANQAKNEFLSRMSHELRTPLNAILGFGQLLDMEENLSARRRESIQHILKAGEHLLNLVNEVLDISRIEAGTISLSTEPVEVADTVSEVLGLMRPLAASYQVHLQNYETSTGDRFILADRQRLKQVLLNLVSNAIKYNHRGGAVMITGTMQLPERVFRIKVRDTGRGLVAEEIKKLFTPFERLHAPQSGIEGTGMGLALSRRLIEAMGGQAGVDSAFGEGSTFWVELPLAPNPLAELHSQLEAEGMASAPASPAQTSKYTILYIEDNLPNLELIEMVLESRPDIRLVPAMQGSTGFDLAVEHHPDLILLDLHLPDISGPEVLRRLQNNPATADIPVIVVSADATAGQIQRLRDLGARGYLTKPINIKQFLTILDQNLN